MYKRLSSALLEDVCHPVSAIVSIGECGEILLVHLVDTQCCCERMRIDERAEEIWLMCSRDDGGRTPLEAEKACLCRARQLARGRKLRFFLASEYWECIEMDPDRAMDA